MKRLLLCLSALLSASSSIWAHYPMPADQPRVCQASLDGTALKLRYVRGMPPVEKEWAIGEEGKTEKFKYTQRSTLEQTMMLSPTFVEAYTTDGKKIEGKDLPYVAFGDSDKARVGDWVVAIGNPFGLGGTATAGIVSARGRDIRFDQSPYSDNDYLQLDAPINFGNSGGPVFNTAGQVVGVNTAIFSPNGGNVGIGFAIPSNQVKEIITDLRENGTVERGWLGVQIQDLDEDLAKSLKMNGTEGALVVDVNRNSRRPRSTRGAASCQRNVPSFA